MWFTKSQSGKSTMAVSSQLVYGYLHAPLINLCLVTGSTLWSMFHSSFFSFSVTVSVLTYWLNIVSLLSYVLKCHNVENLISADTLVCSMWWCLLWGWKFGFHCKWLAHCTAPSVSEGILSRQWFNAVYEIPARYSQHSSSGLF